MDLRRVTYRKIVKLFPIIIKTRRNYAQKGLDIMCRIPRMFISLYRYINNEIYGYVVRKIVVYAGVRYTYVLFVV